ncbi:MAG TPA: hypothetical protein VKW06_20080 [Candidatus Angelobacter sp.]|nr:hypothetical protein [Candidatus Angelobacter sp.]
MKKKAVADSTFVTKAFTVRQPWAHLIMAGKKDVENRSFQTHGSVGSELIKSRVLRFAAREPAAARNFQMPFRSEVSG